MSTKGISIFDPTFDEWERYKKAVVSVVEVKWDLDFKHTVDGATIKINDMKSVKIVV